MKCVESANFNDIMIALRAPPTLPLVRPITVQKDLKDMLFWGGLLMLLAIGIITPIGKLPALSVLLDPAGGLLANVRSAGIPSGTLSFSGLEQPVEVVIDTRGVPHIYAQTDADGVRALAYLTARDRLFQLDFVPRVAAGNLSAALGASALDSDRYLRGTGMHLGARRTLERIYAEDGIEKDLLTWYTQGVNAYQDALDPKHLPVEFKLMGYTPKRFEPIDVALTLQYMAFDLSYDDDEPGFNDLRAALGNALFDALYGENRDLWHVPIIPEPGGTPTPFEPRAVYQPAATIANQYSGAAAGPRQREDPLLDDLVDGYIDGEGSNNWILSGSRTTTGNPILAGDMHLNLSLPAIWYEAHLVTPSMDVYGVTVPGSPLLVAAFTPTHGWTFTNTGSDQMDHYALTLDSTRTQYLYEGQWRDLTFVPDTHQVHRARYPVIDTLVYSHWGPVQLSDSTAMATQWTAHHASNTLRALWEMHQSTDFASFTEAVRYWDTPMQNIAYADVYGNIALRSTGHLPIRQGRTGIGLLDGSSAAGEWIGRVPFDELPYSYNPVDGYLTSTNQRPADSLYPYFLGHDWRSGYRGVRIDSLLSQKPLHSVEESASYQADVLALQRFAFEEALTRAAPATSGGEAIQTLLLAWDGQTSLTTPAALPMHLFLKHAQALLWDEALFIGHDRPINAITADWMARDVGHPLADRQDTPETESALTIAGHALDSTYAELAATYGTQEQDWIWGDHHQLIIKHLTRNEGLRPLWRGPFAYPGFAETLSPAANLMTTASASWRVNIDFSSIPAVGTGIYPGGQSGNPFSRHYDDFVADYLQFRSYPLIRPSTADAFPTELLASRLQFTP